MLLESIKKKISKNRKKYSILFIHGIAASFGDWDSLIKRISGSCYKIRYNDENEIIHNFDGNLENSIWNISFYSKKLIKESFFGDLTTYAERLNKIIDIIKKLTGIKKVIIIAHSMGGLISKKYMTLSKTCWKSVQKILTVGTPHAGVKFSLKKISGQLKDLRAGSSFLQCLNEHWEKMYRSKKWGVIGAINNKSILNRILEDKYKTDSAGPGYIMISSAIPFGEWKEAIENIDGESYNTDHFGFRSAVYGSHRQLLNCDCLLKGLLWALE
jgi:triacylglycerol esterase/lipase EstA (alpha/beta hydrolase family)